MKTHDRIVYNVHILKILENTEQFSLKIKILLNQNQSLLKLIFNTLYLLVLSNTSKLLRISYLHLLDKKVKIKITN